jgi:5-methylcytosine-specific restriction endonuclease McrA
MAKTIAKIRDLYICQWCWKDCNSNKSDCHWSHIINEARDHRLATNEYNIKALCYHCHLNLWHKDPNLASEWFNNKFPWRYEELNNLHIEYSKMWKIWIDWHIKENERLKILINNL